MARYSEGGLPEPDASGEQGGSDYAPFLKYPDIGRGRLGDVGRIVFLGEAGRSLESQYGKQIVFPVKVGSKRFDFAIKLNSGNHTRLFDLFGRKVPKGPVNVEIRENMNRLYIAIVNPVSARAAKAKPKSKKAKRTAKRSR